jgi:hypothetical protein
MDRVRTARHWCAATEKARWRGYRKMDAYSPIPDRGAERSARRCRERGCRLGVASAACSAGPGSASEYWVSVIAYPMNIGDRPLNSWPQFIPVMFETTVLGAALTAFVGMWALNKLPQPYHRSSTSTPSRARRRSVLLLVIETTDPRFERHAREVPRGSASVGVSEVAPKLLRDSTANLNSQPRDLAFVDRGVDWVLGVREARHDQPSRASGACRQDMHDAPRYEPLEASAVLQRRRFCAPLWS